jgi:CheY-like chemotaxis protein
MAEVLVVGKQSLVGDVMIALISAEGHAVTRSEDADRAMIDLDPERPPSLVVLHLTSPSLEPFWRFITWLRTEPRIAATKVILLTQTPEWAQQFALAVHAVIPGWGLALTADALTPGSLHLEFLLDAVRWQLAGS